jgi:putative membrane protein
MFQTIVEFHKSTAIRNLFVWMRWIGVYTAILVFVRLFFFPVTVNIDPIFISLVGTLLSLLLVFRTNAAYDRFWEGRKIWGNLINHSRSMAMMLGAILPKDDVASRLFFARHISAFAFALKSHLRNGQFERFRRFDSEIALQFHDAQHIPNAVATAIMDKIQDLYRSGALTPPDLLNVKSHHEALVEVIGVCERIKQTPIPRSYRFYIRLFITMYLCIMPFLLMDKYGYYTIPAVMFAAYVLMGIEMIADEIEEPFGFDSSDLPLDEMSINIMRNVFDILSLQAPELPSRKVVQSLDARTKVQSGLWFFPFTTKRKKT